MAVAVGWAAPYFEQASLGDSVADGPADYTFGKWVLLKESASQAHNRCSISI